jgi:hypothetical protein
MNYLGNAASAIHKRSEFAAKIGKCETGGLVIGDDGFPFVIKTSIINCKHVSHRTGSPNRTRASIGKK